MLEKKVREKILKALQKIDLLRGIKDRDNFDFSVKFLEREEFGDLTTDVAFRLSKILGISSQEMSQKIVREIELLDKGRLFKKIEAKGGYINFFITEKQLWSFLQKNLKGKNKKIKRTLVIDYSSPNIAKPFGVGHLRSTIIGQAIYNLYKKLGWQTIGDNHLGDWGTQFGKIIYQVERIISGKSARERNEFLRELTVDDVEKLYVDFHKEAQKNPTIEDEARKWFRKLELGDKEALRVWKWCKRISLKEFNKIYDVLGVKIDNVIGESFYKETAKKVVKEALKKKLARESEGAIIMDFSGKYPPAILLKSDKTTTYFSRDLAAIKIRLKRWKPNMIIYEVGKEQSLYFKQLFEAVRILGWIKKEKLIHVSHGLLRGRLGKLSTRKGTAIHLEEVLKEAGKRAEKLIDKKSVKNNLERKKIAQIVGIGAIKFNDLFQEPSKDIYFSWDKILNLKGDSGPYVQYTACRIKTLLNKSRKKKFIFLGGINFSLLEEERNIIKEIVKFPGVVEKASRNFSPNLVARFALNLSKKYNYFYDNVPVLSSKSLKKRNFRLFLSFLTLRFLKESLNILGIDIPPKM